MTSINNLDVDYFEVEQIALMSPMGTDVVEQHWNLLFFISGSGGGRLLSNAAHAICRLHLKRNKASAAARWRQRAGRLYVRGL
ncbi:hypothetical protein [Thiolapillus sp.]|uniref:hypothetical protein n=2 Tax=Thiolapillus sp. TaxID=2017437 RepID=UPI0025E97761|nr:hypothetical protein [Thiolapillus sp.]